MTSKNLIALAILPLILGGCAVGPDYKAPEPVVPVDWRVSTASDSETIANTPWWEIFHDEDLKNLIQAALIENKDIKITLARLAQARAAIGVSDAGFFPSVNYSGGAYETRARQQGPGSPNFDGFSLGGSIQWEIDLWGRIRRLSESATAQYFVAEENKNAVVLALVSDVATGYFRLCMFDSQLTISEQTAKTRIDAYKLAEQRFNEGISGEIDKLQFESDMLSAQAQIAEFKRLVAVQENALSVLIGKNPDQVIRKRDTLTTKLFPQIPAGIPSELLQRRPDVRAAEQQIRSANAQIGAAVANFFPKISLTGALGFINPSLGNLLEHNSMGRQGGGGLLGPIFNGGEIYYSVKAAEARTQEAVATYEKTVINAFREVNDTLASLQTTRERIDYLERQVATLERVYELARNRYEAGVDDYLPSLDASRNLFTAKLLLEETRASEYDYAVGIYKALGGGWQTSDLKPLVDGKGEILEGPGSKQPNEAQQNSVEEENNTESPETVAQTESKESVLNQI
jgi:multidrug efflux system outer membrane protein